MQSKNLPTSLAIPFFLTYSHISPCQTPGLQRALAIQIHGSFCPLIRGGRGNLTWISPGVKRRSTKVKSLRNMDIHRDFASVTYQEGLLLDFPIS